MDYQKLVEKQRNYFNANITKSYEFRLKALNKLEKLIYEYEEDLYEAFKQDLAKSKMETYESEIGYVLASLKEAKKKLKKWQKPKRVGNPIYLLDSKSYIIYEPYGVVLIISPFNYPFQLTFIPLIGALVAGNTAIIKPSELTPNVARIIAKMLNEAFEEEYLKVVEGDVQTTTNLLQERFDYIFFTGSYRVGKIVMKAASEYLSPITLELGGKSPCIISKDVDLKKTAQKIAWAKFLNTGQTCVAPDYILIDQKINEQFIEELKKSISNFYHENPQISEDYGRICTINQTKRLKDLIETTDGFIELGGQVDLEDAYVAPTIISNVKWDDSLMQEEIFGPLLPIITYQENKFNEEVIQPIKEREKPLALYLFTNDNELEKKVLFELSFGGGIINDTLLHLTNNNLPFGGVGHSGIGNYHGKYSFMTFSHKKSIVKKGKIINLSLMYPPYTKKKFNLIKKVLK